MSAVARAGAAGMRGRGTADLMIASHTWVQWQRRTALCLRNSMVSTNLCRCDVARDVLMWVV